MGALQGLSEGGLHLGGTGEEPPVEVEKSQELFKLLDAVWLGVAAEGLHLGRQRADAL